MIFAKEFPLSFVLNLAKRSDRRVEYEQELESHGINFKRFPAIDSSLLKTKQGFENKGRYAHTLSTRLIIKEAIKLKLPSVFIFEDDVILHENIHSELQKISLPADWGMFYLGGQHHVRPVHVEGHLLRYQGALDTHAWGIKAEFFQTVLRILEAKLVSDYVFKPTADILLSKAHHLIPTYGCYPNLAWQRADQSDLVNRVYSNYSNCGSQKWDGAVKGVIGEVYGAKPWSGVFKSQDVPFYDKRYFLPTEEELANPATPPEPDPIPKFTGKAAMLFLTRGAHHQPEVWADYFAQAEGRVSVYGHAAERDGLSGWLAEAQIAEHLPTAWGDISLVRAQLALLKAALQDPANQFFHFLSESCVPIRPWRDFCKSLELNGKSRFHWQGQGEVRKNNPPKAERINQGPRLTYQDWTFHGQWITLNREAAELIAEDDLTGLFEEMFAPDECYFGTLLAMKGYPLDKRVLAQDSTWTKWEGQTSHPKSFDDVTPEEAETLIASGRFFARKFLPDSNIGTYGLHGAALEAVLA